MNLLSRLTAIAALSALLLKDCSYVAAMNEKATGISFSPTQDGLTLFGVGVRKKGPIKAYAVGMYCAEGLKEKLSEVSKAADKGKAALQALRSGAKENPTTFLLQMNFKVGAEKMANAMADSVKPRFSGSSSDVDALQALIADGVSHKGSVGKGDTLQFDCSDAGIKFAVDGKDKGTVKSGGLAKAFCDVYLDDKCVAPSLRFSCLDECCAP